MTLWQFLDSCGARAERRADRLMRAGFYDPRFVVAAFILVGFAGAYIHKPTETMTGAVIAAFAGAWGYYLGSSNSSNVIRDQVGTALRIAEKKQNGDAQPAEQAADQVASAVVVEAAKIKGQGE